MAGLREVLGADTLHPVVEDEAQQQDDQEIDQRERGGGTQVELADGFLREELREERGGVAGPAAGEHERFRVDHEAVHEAQQDRDHQYAAQLGQVPVSSPGKSGLQDATHINVIHACDEDPLLQNLYTIPATVPCFQL